MRIPTYSIDAQETSATAEVLTSERNELSSRYNDLKRKVQGAGKQHSFAQIKKIAPAEQKMTFEQ